MLRDCLVCGLSNKVNDNITEIEETLKKDWFQCVLFCFRGGSVGELDGENHEFSFEVLEFETF